MTTPLRPTPTCQAHWRLRDGRVVVVRAVQAEDEQLESDFVAFGLTPQSRYWRFQLGLPALPPGMAALLTHIDFDQHVAIAALAPTAHGPRQVGEARYVRDCEQPQRAEFALAVADAWQGLGLGSRLLRGLSMLARQHGVQQLYGDVLHGNQAMLRLARAQGFRPQRQGDPRLARVVRELTPLPPHPPICAVSAGRDLRDTAHHGTPS